jgi:hypothetical protein
VEWWATAPTPASLPVRSAAVAQALTTRECISCRLVCQCNFSPLPLRLPSMSAASAPRPPPARPGPPPPLPPAAQEALVTAALPLERLHDDCRRGHLAGVHEAIGEKKELINQPGNLGFTPLHWAAQSSYRPQQQHSGSRSDAARARSSKERRSSVGAWWQAHSNMRLRNAPDSPPIRARCFI